MELISAWLCRDMLLGLAQSYCCAGDLEQATATTQQAVSLERGHMLYPDWYVWSAEAYAAFLKLLTGELYEAMRWADSQSDETACAPPIQRQA